MSFGRPTVLALVAMRTPKKPAGLGVVDWFAPSVVLVAAFNDSPVHLLLFMKWPKRPRDMYSGRWQSLGACWAVGGL